MLVAFSGTHGTGKTTSAFEKSREYKILYPNKSLTVITENAAESPYKINKKTSEKSQLWIFSNQLQTELFKCSKYDIVVSDRSIIDSIAYTVRAGYKTLANDMLELAKHYIKNYDVIYLKELHRNNYFFNDGIRDSDDIKFREDIENILKNLYKKIQYGKIQLC